MHKPILAKIIKLKYIPTKYFISFLLGLIPKNNKKFGKIYHLSFFVKTLVNNYIVAKFITLF